MSHGTDLACKQRLQGDSGVIPWHDHVESIPNRADPCLRNSPGPRDWLAAGPGSGTVGRLDGSRLAVVVACHLVYAGVGFESRREDLR